MAKENKQDCPVKPDQLVEFYNTAKSAYAFIYRKLTLLEAMDNSKLWKAIKAKFPRYQILPETNWISYIKTNLLASIYTVTKSARLIASSDEDKEIIEHINIALEHIWKQADVAQAQLQAGNNAALFNIGITQVGWSNTPKLLSPDNASTGTVVVENISPLRFMRDPYARTLQEGEYCIVTSEVHETVLRRNKNYKEKFEAYLKKSQAASALDLEHNPYSDKQDPSTNSKYYPLIVFFVKYADTDGEVKIAEIHTIGGEYVLYHNADILPRAFPFVELYCNLPGDNIIGTSEPAKIMANNIAYNMLSSIILTSEYKNQFPPRFISSTSGLNLNAFTKSGNDPDRAFVVNGLAREAVHYHQFPSVSPLAQPEMGSLAADIQMTSGIDSRYTGRDTGSVTTTGGVEDMLTRVTLIDTPKILNYERYTEELTKLILAHFIEFGSKREYFTKDNMGNIDTFEINYKDLRNKALCYYEIAISSELPKNKQRIAAMSNMLMEKQMQYGTQGPELITPEEWLECQDLPMRERMLKRMGFARMQDYREDIAKTLFNFSSLVNAGLPPEDSINALAQNKFAEASGEAPPNEIPAIQEVPYGGEQQAPMDLMQGMGGQQPAMPGMSDEDIMSILPAEENATPFGL